MSRRWFRVTGIAVLVAGLASAAGPAFAWYTGCGGGHPVPEPSTLALLGVVVPGAIAWAKCKLG